MAEAIKTGRGPSVATGTAAEVGWAQEASSHFPKARQIPFSQFNNRFAGRTCYVVGRGPTEFDYEDLAEIQDPVFFINDAVALEKHVSGESFFFAHDAKQLVWLNRRIKSTAVLPVNGKIIDLKKAGVLAHAAGIAFYRWRTTEGEKLLRFSRGQLARQPELYTHTGTIHSLLHFLWFCGFKKVVFIGCDGINDKALLRRVWNAPNGYDSRLENFSKTSPWWQYGQIRATQDRLCKLFGFETLYLGTPRQMKRINAPAVIPRMVHFIWLGGPLPRLAAKCIEQFRELHPGWKIHVWHGLPEQMPPDLREMALATPYLCMRSDIIRAWVLHQYGGLYLDTDIFCVRNTQELLAHPHFVIAGLAHPAYNGVMGTVPRSRVMAAMLDEMRRIHRAGLATQRTAYGPALLQELVRKEPGLLTVLPAHYFYIIHTQGTALRFIAEPPGRRRELLQTWRNRMTDAVEPFGIHLWGIPPSEMPACYFGRQSSWTKPLGRGDALLRRIGGSPTQGAEVGVLRGELSAYLLGHHPSLRLLMVDRWATVSQESGYYQSGDLIARRAQEMHDRCREQALRATDFAGSRRTVVWEESLKAAARVADGSLDWVFLDADHSYEGLLADIFAWLPKLKPGGLLCGHDIDNANFPLWGVRRAVEEASNILGSPFETDRDMTWFMAVPGVKSSHRSTFISAPLRSACTIGSASSP